MSVLTMVVIALAGGVLPSAIITGIVTFRLNRATAVKVVAEAQDVSKRTALAEAEAALGFADRRVAAVEKDCQRCETRLENVTASLESVIEAVDTIMSRVTPVNGLDVSVTVTATEIGTVREAVRAARRHLN